MWRYFLAISVHLNNYRLLTSKDKNQHTKDRLLKIANRLFVTYDVLHVFTVPMTAAWNLTGFYSRTLTISDVKKVPPFWHDTCASQTTDRHDIQTDKTFIKTPRHS